MALTLHSVKGSELTYVEMDDNWVFLRDFTPIGTGGVTRTKDSALSALVRSADYSTNNQFVSALTALTETVGVHALTVYNGKLLIGTTTDSEASTYPSVAQMSYSITPSTVGSSGEVPFDVVIDDTSTNKDNGAFRAVMAQITSGNSDIRAGEFHVRRQTGDGAKWTWGLQVGVHTTVAGSSAFQNSGVMIESTHTGWITAGSPVRNGTGLWIAGEDGWTNFIACHDTDGSTIRFNVDQHGTISAYADAAPGTVMRLGGGDRFVVNSNAAGNGVSLAGYNVAEDDHEPIIIVGELVDIYARTGVLASALTARFQAVPSQARSLVVTGAAVTDSVTISVTGGNLTITPTTIVGGDVAGLQKLTAYAGTGIAAGGTTGAGVTFTSAANFGVFPGSGAPTLSAAKGSLYLRSDGTTTNNRAYINTDGGTTWTALTTAA